MLRPLVWHAGAFAVVPAPPGEPPAGMVPLGVSATEDHSLVVGELLLAQLLALEADGS